VAEGRLLTILRRVPVYRGYLRVELAADGNPEDLEALAQVADSYPRCQTRSQAAQLVGPLPHRPKALKSLS
jgi:hypothetical protein